jgi:hypothetical protein
MKHNNLADYEEKIVLTKEETQYLEENGYIFLENQLVVLKDKDDYYWVLKVQEFKNVKLTY